MELYKVLTAFLVFVVHGCLCYPSGPPPSTCVTLFPKHGVERQTSPPPYNLTLSKTTYSPGDVITVDVAGSQNFKGFQVTVHRVESSGNTEDFIGSFTPADTGRSQVISCLGQSASMWAHKTGDNKTKVTAMWKAPATNQGDLVFYLTVVNHKTEFWHRVPFTLSADVRTAVTPPRLVPKVNVINSMNTEWSTCGDKKGCWLVPQKGVDSCKGSDCQALMTYQKQGNLFVIEMAVRGVDNYIAVGFSDDKNMGDDQTFACTANTDHESVQVGYNPGPYNDRQFTIGISNLTVGQVDGQAYCRFTSEASLAALKTGGGNRTFDLNQPFFLFLAWGHVSQGTDVINKHQDAPAVTSEKINLSVIDPSSEATFVHSSMACVASVFFFYAQAYLLQA